MRVVSETRLCAHVRARRIRRAVAAALAVLAPLALAACGGGGRGPDAVAAGDGVLDKVVWAPFAGEPRSLDVGQSTGGYPEATILSNLCDNLLRLTPEMQVVPGLAKQVGHPDPLTYVFQMRADAKFWDGRPVTAADAVFSLERSLAPTAPNAFFLSDVRDVRQGGRDRIVIRLRKPDVSFPAYLASGAGLVAERAYVQAKGKSYGTPPGGVMCSGPFRFEHWNRGQSLTMTRNTDYWDAKLVPHVKQLEFRFITSSSTLTSALLTGEVDGTFAAPPASLKRLRSSSAGRLTLGPSLQVATVSVTSTDGPLADPRVRQALNIAFDRRAFVDSIYAGAADPVHSAILPPTWVYEKDAFAQADARLPGVHPDLGRARELIAAAGSPSEPLVIATPADPTLQPIAVYVQSVAKKIGLSARLKVYSSFSDYLALFYDPKARAGTDAMININYVPVPDPLGLLATMALPDGLNNLSGYDDPKVTGLVEKALASESRAARAEAITQANAIFGPAPNSFVLAMPKTTLWQSKRITGVPANFSYFSSPWGALIRPAEAA